MPKLNALVFTAKVEMFWLPNLSFICNVQKYYAQKMYWFVLYMEFLEGQCWLGTGEGISPTFGLMQLGWAPWAGHFQPWKVWVLLALGTCVSCEILEHLALLSSEEITNWSLFKRTWASSISLIALKVKDECCCLGFTQRLNKSWLVVINSQTPHKAVLQEFPASAVFPAPFWLLSGACMNSHNSCLVPESVLFILHRKSHWLMIDWCCTSAGCTCVSYWNTEDFHIEIIEISHISFLHCISRKEVSDIEPSAKIWSKAWNWGSFLFCLDLAEFVSVQGCDQHKWL